MNNNRRKELGRAIVMLGQAQDIISNALDDEQDCYDNIPENMQDGDKADKMDEAIRNLEDAMECIDDAKDKVNDACC